MKLRLLPEAEQDLEIGADFYESQRVGLGTYFNDCLASDFESLKLYAGIHEQYRGFFRLLSKRFPFAVYYRLAGDWIEIYAVLDCRQILERSMQYWTRREQTDEPKRRIGRFLKSKSFGRRWVIGGVRPHNRMLAQSRFYARRS